MSCFFHRLISVAHSQTYDRPKSVSMDVNWEWATSDAGGQITDECLAVKRSTGEGSVEWETLSNGSDALDEDDLVATVGSDDDDTATVTLANCLAGPKGFKAGGGSNAAMSQKFRYKGTSIDPISVGS